MGNNEPRIPLISKLRTDVDCMQSYILYNYVSVQGLISLFLVKYIKHGFYGDKKLAIFYKKIKLFTVLDCLKLINQILKNIVFNLNKFGE